MGLPLSCWTTTISGFFMRGCEKSGMGGGFLFFLFYACQFLIMASISSGEGCTSSRT
jgi:hypothetical protein